MIIVTDSHVSNANGNVAPFFDMLELLGEGDEDLVFLGDIFDLWISLPRYEEEIQKRFLQWCRTQRARRKIGFVEGNHEFFVVRRHQDCFTWSDGVSHAEGDLLFVHGDLVNRDDRNYLRWRKLSKNPLTRLLVRFLPGGPGLVHKLKAKMKQTNQAYRMQLPEDWLKRHAEVCFQQGYRHVLVGHFHARFDVLGENGASLRVLPDWFERHHISRFFPDSGELICDSWQKLLRPPDS